MEVDKNRLAFKISKSELLKSAKPALFRESNSWGSGSGSELEFEGSQV